MNTVGEPYSGKPNVRIDEGRPGEAVPNRAAYSTLNPAPAFRPHTGPSNLPISAPLSGLTSEAQRSTNGAVSPFGVFAEECGHEDD